MKANHSDQLLCCENKQNNKCCNSSACFTCDAFWKKHMCRTENECNCCQDWPKHTTFKWELIQDSPEAAYKDTEGHIQWQNVFSSQCFHVVNCCLWGCWTWSLHLLFNKIPHLAELNRRSTWLKPTSGHCCKIILILSILIQRWCDELWWP